MKQLSPSWPLLASVLFLGYTYCQRTCDAFVEKNSLTVDAQTAQGIHAAQLSFQDVVDCLRTGATIRFATKSFSVNESICIDKDMSIASTAEEKTVFECNGKPIFRIRSTPLLLASANAFFRREASVDISDILMRKCDLDSADAPLVIEHGSNVTLRSVKFSRNANNEGPSAIRAMAGSSLTIEDSEFRGNRGSSGTVVLANATNLTVSRSNFTENSATASAGGGGVFRIQSDDAPTTVSITGESRFINNKAVEGDGGVLYASGDKISMTIEEDTLFKGNVAGFRGGAIFIWQTTSMEIKDAFFVENESKRTGGGAIFAEDTRNNGLNMKISNTLFRRNHAREYLGSGGGLRIQGHGVNCTLTDTVSFALNTADLDGGGMHISSQAMAVIKDASFVGNEALNGGGAALFVLTLQRNRAVSVDVIVTNTTFLFNRGLYTDRGGGCIGVAGLGADMMITDCSFSDNDGGRGSGGAIYVFGGPAVKIKHSKFSRNKADWGGALYAENDALFDIRCSEFVENSADEGGAMHVRGNVDVELENCRFKKNRASTEGGAIKIRNFGSDGDELGRFRMTNSRIYDNGAGTNLFEDRLYGTETRGGGILAEGDRVELEVKGTVFKRNMASNGGALSIYAVADCNIHNGSRFERNEATFGGASFLVVDELVDPTRRNEYRIADAAFRKNRVEFEGGAIYVSSTRTEANSVSLNARSFLLLVEASSFEENTARRGGGALSMIGSAVKIQRSTFDSNGAVSNSTSRSTPFLGYGGAVNVQTGSSAECRGSQFLSNTADVGGAVFVRDGSFEGESINFTRNRVFEQGVGGAAAVEVSKGRDIPVLNSANRLRNIVFQCGSCKFDKNNGSRAGGALHLHDMDPGGTFTEDNELKIEGCTYDVQNTFRTEQNELTCPTYFRFLNRVNARSVRFSNTQFTENEAKAGGAIFTNNYTMISILPNLQDDPNPLVNNTLAYVLDKNETEHLEACNVSFKKNRVINDGYGDRAASTPFTAYLFNLDDGKEGRQRVSFANNSFLSGDRLRFDVEFTDGIGERVTFAYSLTGYVSCDEEESRKAKSDCVQLEISGQETAQVNEDGRMDFTAVRLRGFKNQTYTLRIDYRSTSELQTLNVNPSFIHVTIRPCMIGEMTVSEESEALECQECSSSTYNFDPEVADCQPCPPNGKCDSRAITPDDGYWQASPCSVHIERCLTSHACTFEERTEKLEKMAKSLRSCNISDAVLAEYRQAQCTQGHSGPLCGSCESSYGSSLSSGCKQCPTAFGNVAVICTTILIVLGLSGITVRGALNAASINCAKLSRRGGMPRFIQLSNVSLTSRRESREIEDSPERSEDTAENEGIGRLPAMETTLAKWKAVEIFKIMLSYIQMTVLIASLDVGWTVPILIMAEIAEFMGGLAVESIRRSVMCLSTEETSPHPTVLASITTVCLIPFSALLLHMLFWMSVALYRQIEGPFQYVMKRFLLSTVVLWYVTSVPVIRAALSAGLCVNVYDALHTTRADEQISYWAVDTSLECFKGDHLMLAVLVFTYVSIVYGGLLILFIFILGSSEDRLTNTNGWVWQTTGFLYRSYRPGKCRYWEVVIVMRKAIIAFLVFCSQRFDSQLPIITAAVFITLVTLAQIVATPYRQTFSALNKVEVCSLTVSHLTVLAAALMKSESLTAYWTRLAITIVCGLLNIATFFVFVSYLFVYFADYVKLALREEGKEFDFEAGTLRMLKIWIGHQIQCLVNYLNCCKSDDLPSRLSNA